MGRKTTKWTLEMIVQQIRHHLSFGSDLTASRMVRTDPRLFGAAVRLTGSWRAAVEAAGLDYEAVLQSGKASRRRVITKWTRESILREVGHLWARGEDIRFHAMQARLPGLCNAVKQHGLSWEEVLRAAGITPAAAAAAAKSRRGWQKQWLRQLEAQAKGREPEGGENPQTGRRPLWREGVDDPSWLERLGRE